MLCKLSDDSVNITEVITPITEFNQRVTFGDANWRDFYSYTITKKGESSILYNIKSNETKNSYKSYIRIYKNETQIDESSEATTKTGTIPVTEGDIIKISIKTDYSLGTSKNVYYKLDSSVSKVYKNQGKKDKIFELKPIGKKATVILFGRLPNGEWRDGN